MHGARHEAKAGGPTRRHAWGAALLAFGLACGLTGCALGGPGEADPGHFEGSVYINEALGLRVPFPPDWHVLAEGETQDAAAAGRTVLSGGDPTGGPYRSAGNPTSRTLFTVFRHPRGSVQGMNPSVVGGLENVVARPQIQTAADYLRMLEGFLGRGGVPITFDPIQPETIMGGQPFALLPVTIMAQGDRIAQVYFCRRIDDSMLTIVATFATQEQWDEIDAVLQGLTMAR
jgi:hypothetical protein